MNSFIGIDPGKGGAIAVISGSEAFATDFKDSCIALVIEEQVSLLRSQGHTIKACIEAVHSFPGQGVASSFAFGKAYGEALGALDALFVPYFTVSPQKWQKTLPAMPKKKDGAAAHKRALKMEAQRRFPQCKPTLKTCDALLIAEYARRIEHDISRH